MGSTAPVEREIARDLARRGLVVAPLAVLAALVLRGSDGAVGAALGIAVVLANFALAATAQARAARRSAAVLATVLVGGYLVRLAIVTVAILLVRNQTWLDFPTFGITLAVTHLGLLVWEAKAVSLTLAFPGLKPARATLGGKH